MKQLTLKQKTKTRFAYNLQHIKEKLHITELEHDLRMVEVGCLFLEEEFPRDQSYLEKWYLEYAYSKSFWKWWKLEWNNWLTQKIEQHEFHNGATIEKAMAILIHRNGTKDAFHNQYIKLIHNGNTRI